MNAYSVTSADVLSSVLPRFGETGTCVCAANSTV